MSRSKEIDMSGVRLLDDLRIGCVYLKEASKLPLTDVFVTLSATEVSITFKNAPESGNDLSLVSIVMFRFPKGRAEFQRLRTFFGQERKKRARLPDGVAFDPSILAIREAPPSWTHDGYARSGRDFVHTYESGKTAVHMRALLRSSESKVLDNPLLKRIHKNLRIVEGQWIVEYPETQSRRSPRVRVRESNLKTNVVLELNEAAARARKTLAIGRTRSPEAIVKAIARAIDETRGRPRVAAEERQQIAVDLGTLWGDALCAAEKWEWRAIHPSKNKTVFAVRSPTRSHAINPISLVYAIVSSKRVANTSELLFNMIVAGRPPESAPESYTWLS